MADKPWLEAIKLALEHSGEPTHYSDIANIIEELGLRDNLGATPKDLIASYLSHSINNDKENCPFVRVARGFYQLRTTQEGVASEPDESENTHPDAGLINAFGMYWNRDKVDWSKPHPQILGRQTAKSDPIDFGLQTGIYLLHDRREVIYVGRAVENPIVSRLREHTSNRLGGRWDRFSWFGVLPVIEKTGELGQPQDNFSVDALITTMEALLIEGLEPRQNRKRGDDISAVEFLQAVDPEVEAQQRKALLMKLI